MEPLEVTLPTASSIHTQPPRGLSLFWRTFILLSLLMLCSTLVWLLLFRTQEYEPRVLRNAHQLATVVNLTRNALIHTDAIARVSLLKSLAEEEDVRLVIREPGDTMLPFGESTLETRLADTLIERLGPDTVVASSVNGERGLWVGFQIERDSYWLQMDPERLRPLSNSAWIVWLALAAALSLLGAAAITARINRPLKQLSLAATRVREGRYRDTALDEDVNTPEIREVNVGFNRMAERLAKVEEERTLMLAGISHDLRTPLARLRLETELSVPDAQAQRAMSADIDQLDDIIDKFLGYARPDHTELESVLLAPIISKCITPFRSASHMDIQVHVPEDLLVMADPVELGRVVSNLLENARRYGQSLQDGTSHVEIEAQTHDGQVLLRIRDQGPGVPEDQLGHLTQPFYRGNTARTSAMGSGLGLAIVERAIERMGGKFLVFNHARGGLVAVVELKKDFESGLVQQRHGPGFDALALPHRTQFFGGLGLHVDLTCRHPQGPGHARVDGQHVRGQLGRLRHDGAVDVDQFPALGAHPAHRLGQQYRRIRPLELRIGVRKVPTDVSQPCGAQHRVGDGVKQHIRIGMAQQARRVRNGHPAQNQLAPGHQGMHVPAFTNTDVVHALLLKTASAKAKSAG